MPNPKGNPATLEKYKPKWKHGNTRTIRVPVALADRILNYAHKIDEESVTQANSNGDSHVAVADRPGVLTNEEIAETLTQVTQVLEQITQMSNQQKLTNNLKKLLKADAIDKLKSLTQVLQEQEGIETN